MAIRIASDYMTNLRNLDRVTDDFSRFINGELTYRVWDDEDSDYHTVPVEVPEFDTVVATGVSGLMCLPLFAQVAKCHWLAIRKPKDGSHSNLAGEGMLGDRWLFVDDFISSGQTLARCAATVSRIAMMANHRTDFVGAYQYERIDYRPFDPRPRCVAQYLQRDWVWDRSVGTVVFDYYRSTEGGPRIGDDRPSVLDMMIEVQS